MRIVSVAVLLFLLFLWAAAVRDSYQRQFSPSRPVTSRPAAPAPVRESPGRAIQPPPWGWTEEEAAEARERAAAARERAAAENRERAHLRRLMDAERAMEQCVALMVAACDCTAQAVQFARAMHDETRMSMTRRRRLDASMNIARLCLEIEEGVSLDDYLSPGR